jgi:hypothetical protein
MLVNIIEDMGVAMPLFNYFGVMVYKIKRA